MDDPVTSVLVPSLVVGGVIAFLLHYVRRLRSRTPADPFTRDTLSTDVINMARIRVAGIGGLGLVAMATVVALNVPKIGQTLAVGLVLGGAFAAFLIVRRWRNGPMPSSGQRTGANVILSIDNPMPDSGDSRQDSRERPTPELLSPVS